MDMPLPPRLGAGGDASPPTPPVGNPLVGYWMQVVLQRYAQFTGRARRAEYWWFTLASVIVSVFFAALGAISTLLGIIYPLYILAVLVPTIAVTVRRLHDTDKSGWWILIGLVPVVGGIILLLVLCIDSTRAPNRYGLSEKYAVG